MASSVKNDHEEDFKYWFRRWINQGGSNKISILLTGKTGVGKSRLVNSLIGKKVADEGRKKEPCTRKVRSYSITIGGIDIVVWDSPGLQDGTTNEPEYLQDMSTRIKEVDLVIYCLKMDDTRLRNEDLKAMRTLTEVFGKKLWENSVFALTFANKVQDPDAEDDLPAASKKYFTEELKEWDIVFRKHLPLKAKIDLSVLYTIPTVPTGLLKKLELPDRKNWLTEFWFQCYERMKTGCRVSLLNVNRSRIHLACQPSSLYEMEVWEKIVLSKMDSTRESVDSQLTVRGATASFRPDEPSSFTQCAWNRHPLFSSADAPPVSLALDTPSEPLIRPTPFQGRSAAEATSTPSIQQPDHSASTKCYPDLHFDSSQTARVDKSTWEAFKYWVGDKWEGIKKVGC